MFGVALVINIAFQNVDSAIDKDLINERPHHFSIRVSSFDISDFGRPINHGMAGEIGAFSRLNIVPMLDGQIAFESEDLKSDSRAAEVILGMSKYEVAVRENTHDIDSWRAFGQALEQRCQAFTPFVSLGVVLNVLIRIDDGHRCLITCFNALEQGADLVFSFFSHGYFNCNLAKSHSPGKTPASGCLTVRWNEVLGDRMNELR